MNTDDTTKSTITETDQVSTYWAARPYVGAALRASVERARVLLVPHENFRDAEGPLFHAGTSELYRFLREQVGPDDVEVCVDEDKYKEFSLHGSVVFITTIVVNVSLAPILGKLLYDYVKRRLSTGLKSGEVRARVILETDTGGTKRALRLEYDGPALNFEKVMRGAIDLGTKQLASDATSPNSLPDQVPAAVIAGAPAPALPASAARVKPKDGAKSKRSEKRTKNDKKKRHS